MAFFVNTCTCTVYEVMQHFVEFMIEIHVIYEIGCFIFNFSGWKQVRSSKDSNAYGSS